MDARVARQAGAKAPVDAGLAQRVLGKAGVQAEEHGDGRDVEAVIDDAIHGSVCTLNIELFPHLRRVEWHALVRECSLLLSQVDDVLDTGFYCLRNKCSMWNWTANEFETCFVQLIALSGYSFLGLE